MADLRPPFAYYGGKQQLAHRIVAALPPHEHYIEPFAGSLAVLLAKPPSKMETINDLDGDLVHFWRILRDRPRDLIRACAMTPHSRTDYLEAYDRPDALDDVERARRVWSVLAQGRSGCLRKTGWRFHIDPDGSSISMGAYMAGYVDRMAAVAERLARVSLEARPAREILDAYGADPGVLLYVDPPYLASTRSGTNYQHEMPTEAEHRDLAAALAGCKATVVLSGYDSPLYDDLYADWHVTRFGTITGQGGTRQARTEVLWCNRVSESTLFEVGGVA